MADQKRDHWVEEHEGEPIKFECGHEGAEDYIVYLFGIGGKREPAVREKREHCGQCALQYVTRGLTQCSHCDRPVLAGQPCVWFEDSLRCLGVDCSPGPAFAPPGKWSGEEFIADLPPPQHVVLVFFS